MNGKINYPVDSEDLRVRYIEYMGDEPQIEFIEALSEIINRAYNDGKASAVYMEGACTVKICHEICHGV